MLPGVGPGAVGEHIANGIAGDGLTVVTRQQIAPGGVAIAVVNGALYGTQSARCVGILLAAGDIAPVVISPNPGLACRLVVLPGQMVGRVGASQGICAGGKPWNPKVPWF